MIPIAKPIIDEAEKARVIDVLDSGMISIGQVVKDFENEFAKYTGSKHAIATSSGTSALHIALKTSGIQPGDKVLTTPFSFVATANAILYSGAIPVFCDVEEETFNIDPKEIRKYLEHIEGIKGLLIVHLYGHSCPMDEIMEIVKEYDLILVEDAAQAHGALYKGVHVGNFGSSGIFSFYPTKNMTTAEGGMVITNDDEVNKYGRIIREHGDFGGYDHRVLGYNYRMTNIEAAIGLSQLEKLESFNKARKENACYYMENLAGIPWLQLPVVKENCEHCFHQFTLKIPKGRDAFVEYLAKNGVGSKVYYPITIPAQTMYKDMGYDKMTFPVSEKLCGEVVSIPVHPAVSHEDREKIVKIIKSFSL